MNLKNILFKIILIAIALFDVYFIRYIIIYNPYKNNIALTIVMFLGSSVVVLGQYRSTDRQFITSICSISIVILTLTSLIRTMM